MKAHQAQALAAMREKEEREKAQPKTARWQLTKLDFSSPEDLEVQEISRDVAVKLIQDLAQELAGTGTTRLVLRSGSRFMVFKVDSK